MQGYLCLILHAHLPYVRHPEHDKFLEESWLFEGYDSVLSLIVVVEDFEGGERDMTDHYLERNSR